jgi:hypothetical protein
MNKNQFLFCIAALLVAALSCQIPSGETQPAQVAAEDTPSAALTRTSPESPGNAAAITSTYLPVVTEDEFPSGDLIQPADLTYLGAFRLPGGDDPPLTFAYGGNAMTFNPDGDSGNGSLFIMGHDRQPWGGLPDGGQVAEISIPAPVISTNLDDLNTANFVQNFTNVAAGYFTNLEELPRIGMTYLNNSATGPKIHLSWEQHHKPDTPHPTFAWFNIQNPFVFPSFKVPT